MPRNFTSPVDMEILRNLARLAYKNGVLLEVGSYVGDSALALAGVLSELGGGSVTCVDKWHDKNVYDLFKKNIKSDGLENSIIEFKGTSDEFAQQAIRNYYDLIFIDGDHSYSQVKKDIENYLPLVREGGILCGHDLELLCTEIDEDDARKHAEEDYIYTIKGRGYHPGVTLAVKDVLKNEVGVKGLKNYSMWATEKTKDGWKAVKI